MSKVITVEILLSSVEAKFEHSVLFSHIPHNHSSEIKCFDGDRENCECPYGLRKLNKKRRTHSIDGHAYCGAHIYTSVNFKFKTEISSENVLHNLISSLKSNRRYAGIKCDALRARVCV